MATVTQTVTPSPTPTKRANRRNTRRVIAKPVAVTPVRAPGKRAGRRTKRITTGKATAKATTKATAKTSASPLAKALAAQMQARGLSLAAAARAIGVNPVGLRRTLSKNSTPNARTVKRYQRWLGSDAPAAKSATVPSGRTRMESGSAVLSPAALRLTLGELLRAAAAPETPAVPAISKADRAYLADALARRVHDAPAATRRLVGTVLATLRS